MLSSVISVDLPLPESALNTELHSCLLYVATLQGLCAFPRDFESDFSRSPFFLYRSVYTLCPGFHEDGY